MFFKQVVIIIKVVYLSTHLLILSYLFGHIRFQLINSGIDASSYVR